MERRKRLRLFRPSWRNDEQSPRRSRDQHVVTAPAAELHGLREHAHAAGSPRPAPLARPIDRNRSQGAYAADVGTRQSLRPLRARHVDPTAAQMIQMAAGDTNVGSRPSNADRDRYNPNCRRTSCCWPFLSCLNAMKLSKFADGRATPTLLSPNETLRHNSSITNAPCGGLFGVNTTSMSMTYRSRPAMMEGRPALILEKTEYPPSLLQNSSNAANFPCVRGGGAAGAQAGAGLSCVTRSI